VLAKRSLTARMIGSRPGVTLLRTERPNTTSSCLRPDRPHRRRLGFCNPNLSVKRRGMPWDPMTPWPPGEFSAAFYWRVGVTGLPRISFKNVCRTTYATLMADANVPVQVVQRLLGHSSLSTTMKHYVPRSTKRRGKLRKTSGSNFDAARRNRAVGEKAWYRLQRRSRPISRPFEIMERKTPGKSSVEVVAPTGFEPVLPP